LQLAASDCEFAANNNMRAANRARCMNTSTLENMLKSIKDGLKADQMPPSRCAIKLLSAQTIRVPKNKKSLPSEDLRFCRGKPYPACNPRPLAAALSLVKLESRLTAREAHFGFRPQL
jgi:hypothetical protein